METERTSEGGGVIGAWASGLEQAVLYVNLLATIGRTPVVELRNLPSLPEGVRILAKLEGQNPTGSVKDRIVARMIRHAESEGAIAPGSLVVEATTGNTGIALAMIGRARGYRVRLVVPENVFPAIPRILAAYGAEIVWMPAAVGIEGAIAEAERIAKTEGGVVLGQFASAANPATHYEETGPEILDDVPEVDAFVAGLGTGGTLMGVGRRLKEAKPGVRIIAVEPHPGSQVQGLRSLAEGYVPPIVDLGLLDGKILVRSANAFRAARMLMEREGIFGGASAGAALHGALRWAQRMRRGTIVVLFADGGWKYLGSSLWGEEPPEAEDESLDDVLWW